MQRQRQSAGGLVARAGRPALAAYFLLCLTAAACDPKRPAVPNVLIIVVDTLRADHVGIYGAQRETTPYLDALARQGVIFENAFTVAPSTWQSFTSILTALIPPHHGVRFIFDDPLDRRHVTLAGVLRRNGYVSAAFDPIPFMREMTGGHVFDEYFDSSFDRAERPTDAEVMSRAVHWIDAHDDKPWFVFIRLHGPHWPYAPKQAFHDLFANDEGADHGFNSGSYGAGFVPDSAGKQRLRVTDADAYRKLVFDVGFPPAQRAHMIAHYDACVRTTDEAIADALSQVPNLQDTLVVITSDHGESFGDSGYRGHGPGVEEEVMRVPLIMRFPSSRPQGTPGQRVRQLVRVVDIMPTTLDALGIEPPRIIDGRSLLPAIKDDKPLDLIAYGESDNQPIAMPGRTFVPGVPGKQRMLRDLDWKVRFTPDGKGGMWELYDMSAEGEAADVAAANPQVFESMRRQLRAILNADAGQKEGAQRRALTDDEKERLRVLGYR